MLYELWAIKGIVIILNTYCLKWLSSPIPESTDDRDAPDTSELASPCTCGQCGACCRCLNEGLSPGPQHEIRTPQSWHSTASPGPVIDTWTDKYFWYQNRDSSSLSSPSLSLSLSLSLSSFRKGSLLVFYVSPAKPAVPALLIQW